MRQEAACSRSRGPGGPRGPQQRTGRTRGHQKSSGAKEEQAVDANGPGHDAGLESRGHPCLAMNECLFIIR